MPKQEVENPMILDHLWKDQPKHWGCDWQGNEILEGDEIINDPNTGEILIIDDLVEYLKEKYGFEFTTAK